MLDLNDPEDRQIRWILISASTAAVLGFLVTVLIVAVLISMNFNIMEWLE